MMCKKSESISKLAIALVKAQSEITSVSKDGKNPHFKSKYATLDNIIEETRPVLARHGLAVLQMPGGDGENVIMTTMLMHESGEWLETEPLVMKPVKNDPQGMGSAITYARRYSLSALLSISTDEDDDGNGASHAAQTSYRPAQSAPQGTPHNPTPQSANTNTPPSSVLNDTISQPQIGMIKKLLGEKMISDDKYRQILIGYNVSSSKELTKRDASAIIKQLQEYVPDPAEEPLPF